MTDQKLIDDVVTAFADRDITAPSRDDIARVLEVFETSLRRCGCDDCTTARRERIGLTDHDLTSLARVLHEVVYSPGASFDRAVPGIQEYMRACAQKVAAALPWMVPTPEVELVVAEAHTPTDDEREAITDEALWDFAGDLLDAWNIEDLNPPGLIEQFRDRFVRRFRHSECTPTDDEREALIALKLASFSKRMSDGYPSIIMRTNEEAADLVLAAGFRRSEVPEPSAEHFHIWSDLPCKAGECRMEPQGEPSDLVRRLVELRSDMRHNADEVATLDAAITALGAQAEPSDAQVRSVWDALGPSVTVHLDFEDLRAALRAAGGAR